MALARVRLAHSALGVTETECGWIHLNELAQQRGVPEIQIKAELYRVRKLLMRVIAEKQCGWMPIENRYRARLLRIGTSDIVVEPGD
ncbi:MAG TPA: hypothetical protein VFQ61_34825 [Polyangiaceae bacterium]|nr:hypothetical protein [Polyangiaceae bacterium]